MRSPRAGRLARTAAGASKGFAVKLIYGLAASLVMLSLALALQGTLLTQARETRVEGEGPASSASAARGTRGAVSSRGVASSDDEDEQPLDPAAATTDRRMTQRSPANPQTHGTAPDQAEVTIAPSAAPTASAPAQPAWSTPFSPVAGLLSSGGGTSAAPATVVPPPSTSSAPPASHNGQVRAVRFGTSEGTVCHSYDREFRFEDVEDLYVCVVWTGLSGKYAEQVTFVSPDGNAYQMVTVPFMTVDTPATVDPMMEVEGRTLEAKRAGWGASGTTLVTARLPVSGTFITQYSLAGLWTVQIALNGQGLDHDFFDLIKE